MRTTPSPSSVLRLTDAEVGYHYCELPDDTIFAESIAKNDSFRPGVGFVPIQRFVNGEVQTHLYKVTGESRVAEHVAGPLMTPCGSSDIAIYGSALSSRGELYLCAFNRNSLLLLDLQSLPCKAGVPVKCGTEIAGIPAPNDVAIDPSNEDVLYTAGGKFRRFLALPFTDASSGRIYKTTRAQGGVYVTTTMTKSLKTLAGIEVIDENIWTAQLFNIVSQPLCLGGGGKEGRTNPAIRWKGNTNDGRVWLADNIDRMADGRLVCPAYRTASKVSVDLVLRRSKVSSTILLFVQMASAFLQGERLKAALKDPEVALSFSNTFLPKKAPRNSSKPTTQPPVRLIFMDPRTGGLASHCEIDLQHTRRQHPPRVITDPKSQRVLGQRHHFNEQVTHVCHLDGHIACVNFEQPRILMLKDDVFKAPSSQDERLAWAVTV